MELAPKRYNNDTIEALLGYLQNGGDSSGIELSDKHKDIMQRLRYADEKLRENRYNREDVANFIKGKFRVCRDTAFKDIVMAEKVFSSTYPLNKKYEIGARIEFLKKKINDAFIDKDVMSAATLEKVLQKYYDLYPDYVEPRSPKNITFVINGDIHTTNNNLTLNQVIEEADNLIELLEKKDDY